MRRANIIISLILLGFASFYAYLIANLPARDLPNTLGAAFVPWVLAGILAGLSVILLIHSIFAVNGNQKISLPGRELLGITFLLILIASYIKLMDFFGFVPVSIVFLAILTWLAGSRKPAEIAAFSVTTAILVYLLFHKFFQVQLPTGIFF
ncbi:MAG: tripartite tricarboxylate transporter TctB family protein [Desulfofustis sp.]|jgi:putative tricarboxylic transport membrane protein